MQPPNSSPQPAPPQPGAARPQGESRNRRLRLFLAMGAGILALLCLGGVGVFISSYDEATKIERSKPDAVVDQFLRAYLVNRDDKEAELFTCDNGLDLTRIEAFRTDLQSRESRFSIKIQVVWEGLTVSTSGSRGTVDVDLTRTIADDSEQVTKPWQFSVVDEGGWRVCGATEVV
ncbi:hypothetical protein ACIBSW_06050 [Actinoplanes sp. NPDC049668]|uniref:Rv0361 family membrane protein n=1 Tax=unclassified Actinoplanes TaxID=2626549 RepID=UPI0033BD267A